MSFIPLCSIDSHVMDPVDYNTMVTWSEPYDNDNVSKDQWQNNKSTKTTRFWRKQKPTPAAEPKSTTVVSEKAVGGRNDETVFRVLDVNMVIPPGKVVAVVGPIGAGKSSLLQGIVGAMRKEKGELSVVGSVAYCTQTAWIQVCFLKLVTEYGNNRVICRMPQSGTIYVLDRHLTKTDTGM